MSIDNDTDWRRAFAFWFLFVLENIALVLSIGYFMVLQISIEDQLFVFLVIGVLFTATLFLGRWKPRPPTAEGTIQRWRIGPWTSAFVVLETGFCWLLVCGHIWALATHYKQRPGAF